MNPLHTLNLAQAEKNETEKSEVEKIEDEKNRTRALALTSFIVEAPAGAGKTELLTQRYLTLLPTVSAPEEIIAITFTNKAAAEMRLRIMDSLLKAAKQEKPDQAHKQITYDLSMKALHHAETLGWQLLENPSSLRIFTIDSLCAHLARQMPLMSRFGAQPRVAEDAGLLYAQAAEQTLALLEDNAHGDIVQAALRYVDNDANQLKNLLISMLEKRDQWMHHAQQEIDAETLQATLRHLVEVELQAAYDALPLGLQYLLMPVAHFAAAHLPADKPVAMLADWTQDLLPEQEMLPTWCAVADLLLTDKGEPRKEGGLNVRFGFPATDEGRAKKQELVAVLNAIDNIEALHRVRALPNANDDADAWQMIARLSQLLSLAVAELWLVFQRAGEVDFVEISQRATRALTDHSGEPTELALKLDYKIQHLLVDEFQDTSPGQIELLKRLTMGWQPQDGRTLFAVGDPMQSIYRFRKANVGLFIDAVQQGIGDIKLQKLRLYRNNRSCPPVVNWINETFQAIFPMADEVLQGAIQYRPFIATKSDATVSGIEVHPIIKSAGESAEAAGLREAEAVIAIIQRERHAHPQRKIAVLVRSKKHLNKLVMQLRRSHRDIPFQAVEIEALAGRQVVQDLLSLTHALYHRADRVQWLSVLRAPWCGLTLADLHALAGKDRHSTIWSLMHNEAILNTMSNDGQARLRHVRLILQEAFLMQGRMGVSRWVRGVWLMLNGTACMWETADVVDVQAFFACLDSLDRRQQFSPERMEIEVTKLFAAPDSQGEHLQLMTIHKSKGLEFDVVILPGLGASTGGNNSDKPLVLWEEVLLDGERELLAAPFIPKGARDNTTVSAYDYLESREKTRDGNEAARVLYVAATRAERKLHLVGVANQNAKGEVKPTANTYLDLLWSAVGASYLAVASESVEDEVLPEVEFSSFTPSLVRLAELGIPALLNVDSAMIEIENQPAENPFNPLPTSHASIEADIGSLAHRYMELIAKQGVSAWPTSRISTLNRAMQHWLSQRGHAPEIVSQAAEQVLKLLTTTLGSSDGVWVLKNREHDDAELGMTTLLKQKVKHYVLDRTFIEDHVRWIIDYKTVALSADDNEAALKEVAEQYREQLESYAALFSHEGLEVKCAVFFMSVGKLVQLPTLTSFS